MLSQYRSQCIIPRGGLRPAGTELSPYPSLRLPFANVIQEGEDGSPPQNFHRTEAAGIGDVINLSVIVDSGASCGLPQLASTVPVDQGVLYRSANNIVRLNFDGNVAGGPGVVDLTGQIEVNKLDGCSLGPDLAANFSFTVENDGGGDPTVLVVQQTTPGVLEHLSWYTIRNVNFTAAAAFAPEFKVLVGDVDGDGLLLSGDAGLINNAIPCFAACDPALDVDGDGLILSGDAGLANNGIPVFSVPHPCP